MMSDLGTFQMSQGLDVIKPKAGRAYPIPCEEWAMLKNQINKMTTEPWLYQSLGALFLGAAISTFVTIMVGSFDSIEKQNALVIAWAIVAVTFTCGLACLYFAHKERGVYRERASNVVAQMNLIEKRYEQNTPS